jgi:hypothetical protein
VQRVIKIYQAATGNGGGVREMDIECVLCCSSQALVFRVDSAFLLGLSTKFYRAEFTNCVWVRFLRTKRDRRG